MTDAPTTRETARPLCGAALGEQNGRLMAAYDCYTLKNNPHTKGSRAHAAFIEAFTRARAEQ